MCAAARARALLLRPLCSFAAVALPCQQPVEADATRAAVAAPATLPRALTSFGACTDGARCYVFGGHVGKAHAHSRQNQVGTLLACDLRGGSWEEIDSGPLLQSPALVAHRGRVIRIGGMAARNDAGTPGDLWSTDEVVAFDTATSAWTPLASLPAARSSHDAVVVGDRAIVVGGWRLAGKEREWATSAIALDLTAKDASWQALPAPPFQRRALAVAAVGEVVYALGGLDADGEMCSEAHALDLRTGTWSELPQLPGNGFAVAACGAGGELFASGRDGELWGLDGGRWHTVTELALPRFFHRLLPAPHGQLLAMGGASDEHLATCELVPTRRDTLHIQAWSISWTHPARNRQAFAIVADRLHVFGGNRGKRQHDFEPEHFAADVATVDLRTMTVTTEAPLPQPRQSLVPIVEGKLVSLLGGFGHRDGKGRALAEACKFSANDRQCAAQPPLPAPRTQFGLVAADGAQWLLGGIDYVPERGDGAFAFQLDVLRRSSNADSFAATELRLPRQRRAFGCAVRGDSVWLVGGMREGFAPVPEVDVLDVAKGSWSTGPTPAAPRIAPFLVALGARLVLAGGSVADGDGNQAATTIEVLDAGASEWQAFELPVAPPVLGALAWRERLLVVTRDDERLVLTAVRLPAAPARDTAR